MLAVGGSTPTGAGSVVGPGPFAGSAGFSSIFTRPSYQNGGASITHSAMRSVPDITTDNGDGITDVTRGNDTLTTLFGRTVLARGDSAHKGFDLVSGWGTIDAPRFVPALVRATRASHDEAASRAQAGAQFIALRAATSVSSTTITPPRPRSSPPRMFPAIAGEAAG